MTARYSTGSSDDTRKTDDTQRTTDLTLTNVIAAALAALTTAGLGSMLGAAGTLIGAAGASVITTVGTAVYRSSLERSRDSVRSLTHRTRPLPHSAEGSRAERSDPAAVSRPLSGEQLTGSGDHRPQAENDSRRFPLLRWGVVVLGALGAFVLAMMLITGLEWASGETIGGNGNGTTIGHVINDQPASRKPPTSPQNPGAPASETATPTTAPTVTPTTPGPSTTTPDGGTDSEPSRTTTPTEPSPDSETPAPSLIPTRLPGVGSSEH